MIVEPYLHGAIDDVLLAPLSISYERTLEEFLFARELLGIPKPKESTSVRGYKYMYLFNVFHFRVCLKRSPYCPLVMAPFLLISQNKFHCTNFVSKKESVEYLTGYNRGKWAESIIDFIVI